MRLPRMAGLRWESWHMSWLARKVDAGWDGREPRFLITCLRDVEIKPVRKTQDLSP